VENLPAGSEAGEKRQKYYHHGRLNSRNFFNFEQIYLWPIISEI